MVSLPRSLQDHGKILARLPRNLPWILARVPWLRTLGYYIMLITVQAFYVISRIANILLVAWRVSSANALAKFHSFPSSPWLAYLFHHTEVFLIFGLFLGNANIYGYIQTFFIGSAPKFSLFHISIPHFLSFLNSFLENANSYD